MRKDLVSYETPGLLLKAAAKAWDAYNRAAPVACGLIGDQKCSARHAVALTEDALALMRQEIFTDSTAENGMSKVGPLPSTTPEKLSE